MKNSILAILAIAMLASCATTGTGRKTAMLNLGVEAGCIALQAICLARGGLPCTVAEHVCDGRRAATVIATCTDDGPVMLYCVSVPLEDVEGPNGAEITGDAVNPDGTVDVCFEDWEPLME